MKRFLTYAAATLLVLTCGGAFAGEPVTAKPAATAQTAAAKLDVNLATAEELLAVPGIGPKMAQAIVERRAERGAFRSLDDLLQVRGIKEKTLKAISAYLVVTTSQAAVAAPSSR